VRVSGTGGAISRPSMTVAKRRHPER